MAQVPYGKTTPAPSPFRSCTGKTKIRPGGTLRSVLVVQVSAYFLPLFRWFLFLRALAAFAKKAKAAMATRKRPMRM